MRHKVHSPLPVSLAELVEHVEYQAGDSVLCHGCATEARHIEPGDVFIATCDADRDTHEQADLAVARGAVAVVGERLLPVRVPQRVVPDARVAYGQACHRLAGDPSHSLPVVGVTGSLGKTTTALLIAAVLNVQKQGVAVCSTLAHSDSVRSIAAEQSTPRADLLANLLSSAVEQGCSHAVVELSSTALAEQRAAGLRLETGVITNIRRHHLDRHTSFAAYRALKERMLHYLADDAPLVLNADDPFSRQLRERIARPVLSFGLHNEADVTATVLERVASEQTFLLEAGADSILVRTALIGDQHISNCLAATSVGLLAGLELPEIAAALESVSLIPGRMERIECGQEFSVFVDEGRSPDSLATCLKNVRSVTRGRVLCVASPDEELDPADYPLLGKVLEKGAHLRVITGAAREQEDPLLRSHDVLDGFERPGRAHVIPSREKAIRWALEEARPGDAVVLCGQGHRAWYCLGQRTDDATVARECLYSLAARELRGRPLVFAYHG